MPHITNMELQNLRHLIGAEQLAFEKANTFAQQVNDPQLRSFLQRKAQGAQQNAQNLKSFLTTNQIW